MDESPDVSINDTNDNVNLQKTTNINTAWNIKVQNVAIAIPFLDGVDDKAVNSTIFLKFFKNLRNILLYLLTYCLVQQHMYHSQVHDVEEVKNCWTFGKAFNKVRLILAQVMESTSSHLRIGQRRSFWAVTVC